MTAEARTAVSPGRTVTWLARHVELALAELDMSVSQYRVLGLLDDAQSSASMLADLLTVTRPSVTTLMDGLVARGFVERGTEPGDRRKVTHAVTDAGRAQLRLADEAVNRALEPVFDALPAQDAQHTRRGLEALGELLLAAFDSLKESKA